MQRSTFLQQWFPLEHRRITKAIEESRRKGERTAFVPLGQLTLAQVREMFPDFDVQQTSEADTVCIDFI